MSVNFDVAQLKKDLVVFERGKRKRAFFYTVPVLVLILVGFVFPIFSLLKNTFYNDSFSSNMPNFSEHAINSWDGEAYPDDVFYQLLAKDLLLAGNNRLIGRVGTRVNRILPGYRSLIILTSRKLKAKAKEIEIEEINRKTFEEFDSRWQDLGVLLTLRHLSYNFSLEYLFATFDFRLKDGTSYERLDSEDRIYVKLFIRTFIISFFITLICLFLAFPLSYFLSILPPAKANIMMIFVLLPFWTSLLVRTTSWIVLLQQEGVFNDIFVFLGIVEDENRVQMIYNMLGTVIAMTHILLPFMILPLYSVMKTIPNCYLRAAESLGAPRWLAFIKVYIPQSVPGISAGCLLVFILAIGYYITPALVGGSDGQLISNIIAFHMQKSLNWSFASAISLVLLITILFLYYMFDRIVGIDKLKLG